MSKAPELPDFVKHLLTTAEGHIDAVMGELDLMTLRLWKENPMDKFLLLLKMLPMLIATVKAVEETVQGSKMGGVKHDLVVNTVTTAVQSVPEVTDALQGHDLPGAVSAIATAAVTTLNAAGVFKTSTASPATA